MQHGTARSTSESLWGAHELLGYDRSTISEADLHGRPVLGTEIGSTDLFRSMARREEPQYLQQNQRCIKQHPDSYLKRPEMNRNNSNKNQIL